MRRIPSMLCTLVLLTALFTACQTSPEVSEQKDWHGIDPVFREYWDYLGGMSIIGPAIAPVMDESGSKVQFLQTCKLVFNPQMPAVQRFQLAPLGREMELNEPPVPPPSQPELHYIDGHIVFPDFWPLYERLGKDTVGSPLTEVRYNLIRRRYEQHFANLGFYRLEGSTEVRLLSYGIWACDKKCQSPEPVQGSTMDLARYIAPTFQDFISRMGADFSGFALTDAYTIEDGNLEQILENIVVVTGSPTDPASVHLQPISNKLSIRVEPPRPSNGNPDMFFYATQGNLGYDIPKVFWEYILRHGGIEVWGPPITHYQPLDSMSFHQCFANLCVAYDLRANEEARVRPEPLGYAYKVLFYRTSLEAVSKPEPTLSLPTPEAQEREIVMYIWSRVPVVSSQQSQDIGVNVYDGNQPMVNVRPELTLIFLDNLRLTFEMPATDAYGQSVYVVPPVQASNGTVVIYKVCIKVLDGLKLCSKNSYMVWNNP